MTNPSISSSSSGNESSRSQKPKKSLLLPLTTRRLAAWTVEMTLLITSGLVPLGLGMMINSRTEINRVPLNPVVVLAERAIARPLALPVNYGSRNVAWPTNILWTLALLAPTSLTCWQFYLLSKNGSTTTKRWFGVRVVNSENAAPGCGAIILREGLGRWAIPLTTAYLIWRYSFIFPNIPLLTSLTLIIILAETIGWPNQKNRRSLHDQIAGTYTIDLRNKAVNTSEEISSNGLINAEIQASIPTQKPTGIKKPVNPNIVLFIVGLSSMLAVLTTLIGTQIYIQSQESARRTEQINTQKFLEISKLLNASANISNEDRQRVILALGALNDRQSIKALVNELVKETDLKTLDTIQQALTNTGLKAIPELKRMNQFLASELQSMGQTPNTQFRQNQLILTQQVMRKILSIDSGKLENVDLSYIQMGLQKSDNSTNTDNNLSNLTLKNLDLSGVIFKGANLQEINFENTRFRSPGEDRRWDTYDDITADLSNTDLRKANLNNANLSRIVMNRSNLSRATLNKANLSSTRLYFANLSSSQLVGANLSNAILENASLTGGDISDANLVEVDLYAANLSRISAIGTQLSYANLSKTDWQGADLSEAYLDHANLSNANLSATRLTGANLRNSNLENANLRNADLSRADLRNTNITGADFQGALLSAAKQNPSDQFVETPNLGSQDALVKGVDFTKAKNLDEKQIAFICTQGAIHPRCP
ncbi:pentapeptide repeat-containing protein [Anabaena sp. FACHB-1237]|uniref:pentapeptide repeat-containing protein n=1 Tax=Anabaena sp. FACHB-1237 TaxID=2692769 RepID=UPI001680CC9B|nr:pentapeptide repeat-containing protein [Anabaena sp. FACHB-1237]MBD2139010.1 pentapeptide repeat-containing protein [Anabaena sp. FACHB-1237]